MLYIPFIFFSFLLYKIIKKNGFDVSACITSMYVVISFFSIILGHDDHEYPYGNYSKVEISFIPTFVYCSTIGLCIYPFYKYNSNQERTLKKIRDTRFLDVIVYGYLFVFIFLIAVFWKDILFRIAFGDLGELRNMQYAGQLSNALDTKGGIIRVIGGLFTVIGDGAYFLIPCFFYSLSTLRKSRLYMFFILLGSLTPVILGFIGIDRSKTAFWICLFILSFFMFRKYLVTKEQKKILMQMFAVVGSFLLFYLAAVTISRFGERDEGTSGGLLVYLGQPFINFCNIWDNIDTNHFFFSRALPLTTFALYGSSGTEELVDYIISSYSRSGLHLNVFFTFIGMFLVDMGHFAAIIVPILLFLIINKVTESFRPKKFVTLSSMIVLFAFATILQCGIVTYFYTVVGRALSFWFFIFYSRRFFR